MTYDKATVTVKVSHEGVVNKVEDLINELHEPSSFIVRKVDESYNTEGGGTDGSKILTVEVHEYSYEIPVFTESIKEDVKNADVANVDIERGESELT